MKASTRIVATWLLLTALVYAGLQLTPSKAQFNGCSAGFCPQGQTLDSDVQLYVSRVGAANIGNTAVQALNGFVLTGRSQGWYSALTEVYPFSGNNLTASLVKLKNAWSGTTSLTQTNFTSGDYSQATGMGPPTTNTNKSLGTGVTLSTTTASSTNLTMLMDVLDLVPSAGFYLCDQNAASDCVPAVSNATIGVSGSTATPASRSGYGSRGATYTPTNYYGGLTGGLSLSSSTAAGAFTSNTELTMFRRVSSGSNTFAAGKIGLTALGTTITQAQLLQLTAAAWNYELAVRTVPSSFYLYIGDSITNNQAATTKQQQYTYIVSNTKAVGELNFGISADQTTNNTTPILSVLNRWSYTCAIPQVGKTFLMIGVNDQSADVTTNGNPTLIATYQTSMTTILSGLAACRGANNVYLITQPWNTANNVIKNGAWNTAALAAATASGIPAGNVIDFWAYCVSQNPGGSSCQAGWMQDTIHPNNTGMAQIASQVLLAIP